MPPKKTTPVRPVARTAAKPAAGAKKATVPAKPGAKKGAPVPAKGKPGPKKEVAPAVPKWTPQDEAARKIQTGIRGFLARKALEKQKKEKEEYEALMDRLEKEAFVHLVKLEQEVAEKQRLKEEEERRRKKEEAKRKKIVLEAAFDGDINEIQNVLREVKDLDDKNNIGHDLIGKATRDKHQMSMIEATDANDNTALSEASSGGHVDTIKFLLDKGADPNTRGRFDRTPLYRAAFAGHLEATQVLLQYGADPRLYADDGQMPENVASQKPVQELLQTWDISMTEALLTKLEEWKERRKEEDKKRRQAEEGKIEDQIREAETDYEAHQKRMQKAHCELEKRITEHDESAAMGFDKPEITLAAIHEAEADLEIAKLHLDQARDKVSQLRLALREKQHEGSAAKAEDDLPGLKVVVRELDDVLLRDIGNRIADSGKWPLIIDPTGQASTFLRYRDTNYLRALSTYEMEPNRVRLALLGALRYGKPFILDMMEVNMFDTVSDRFDEIQKGLMAKIMDKSIMKEENYLPLIKEDDGDAYRKNNFNEGRTSLFKFFIVTKNPFPPEDLSESTYPIRVILPG